MNKVEANKHFPLWKVEIGEYVYGRDSGNPWSDPENDIRKRGGIKYFSKANVESEWVEEYEEGMGDFMYGMHQAAMTLSNLQMHYGMGPKPDTVMFEYQGKMFKFTHWFNDQKCVCGDAIDDYYNDYNEDNSVKADVMQSHVFFYEKDCLVMANGKFYLNGEIVATKKEMKENHEIEWYQAENMYPEEVRQKLIKLFPTATQYKSWSASGYLNRPDYGQAVVLPQAIVPTELHSVAEAERKC